MWNRLRERERERERERISIISSLPSRRYTFVLAFKSCMHVIYFRKDMKYIYFHVQSVKYVVIRLTVHQINHRNSKISPTERPNNDHYVEGFFRAPLVDLMNCQSYLYIYSGVFIFLSLWFVWWSICLQCILMMMIKYVVNFCQIKYQFEFFNKYSASNFPYQSPLATECLYICIMYDFIHIIDMLCSVLSALSQSLVSKLLTKLHWYCFLCTNRLVSVCCSTIIMIWSLANAISNLDLHQFAFLSMILCVYVLHTILLNWMLFVVRMSFNVLLSISIFLLFQFISIISFI